MTPSMLALVTVAVGLVLFTIGAVLTWPWLLLPAGAATVVYGLVGVDVEGPTR